ncbi:TonB-dependent receptor plug domain-containing protein [Roseateles koreensis]|uniref:TonB-dependent receptor n=1 Tax=Roseateles koreensis TaxID=2987526 RepID=A0ABT5KS97_9BURK|nr:TonB-dependent receptor [Roseateles koreensis]MDC8785799.1 TonB-dependent receptor [Roseateles koreensis]
MSTSIRRQVRRSATATSFRLSTCAQLALATMATVNALPVLAQAANGAGANKLDSVTVTASRTPMRLGDVIADLTVITREDIERQGFGDLADLLRNTGCAEMTRNGGPGSTTSLYLRGAETRHTLVLVDGVRIDSQSTGGAPWETIPLAQVERVEVLKGPASALYGSDAIGGVVQIFTRKGGKATQVTLSGGVGNLGTARLGASVSGAAGLFDYALSASGERSDGFNAIANPQSVYYNADKDGWKKHNVNLRVGAQFSPEQRVELMALQSHVDAQYDGYMSTADDHAVQDASAVRLSWASQWTAALQTRVNVSEAKSSYETKPSPYNTTTRLRSAALDGSYRLDEHQQINFLAEVKKDHLDNSGLTQAATVGSAERTQNGLALGYLWTGKGFDAQLQLRHDDDSQFGGVDTGTLGLGYRLTPSWRLVGSVGNAFRAPTLYQSFSDYGPKLSIAGVKPLDPEKGRNAEVGLKYAQADNEFSVTTYRNLIDNLIIFGDAGTCNSAYGCYQNVNRARLQGLSLSGSTLIAGVQLRASLDLQAPKDEDTGNLLARRAREFGSISAQTQWMGFDLGAGVVASGKRYDDMANKKNLGGYALLNLNLGYALSQDLKLQVNLDNALDKQYQTAKDYAQAPRTVFVGLRYSPKL